MRSQLWSNLSKPCDNFISNNRRALNAHPLLQTKIEVADLGSHQYLLDVCKANNLKQITLVKKIHNQYNDEFQLFDLFFRRLASHLLGASIVLIIQRQLAGKLSVRELAFIWQLAARLLLSAAPLFQAQRMRESYPWRYGAMAMYLAVSCRDTTLLVNWFQARLASVSMYQHQTYFRSLGFYLGQAAVTPQLNYSLQGSYLFLSGKISVAGNSRTRFMRARFGKTGASCLEQRITQSVFLVRTRTGCLGGTIRLFY